MNESELNNSLRTMAIENGLCEKWKADWQTDWSAQILVDKFYAGLDFYLKKRFIPTE